MSTRKPAVRYYDFLLLLCLLVGCGNDSSNVDISQLIIESCNLELDTFVEYKDQNFNYTIQIPESWEVISPNSTHTLFDFGKTPREEGDPFIYVTEYNKELFEEDVTSGLNKALIETFEYENITIGGRRAYTTTSMPSAYGAYNVFLETDTNYINFAITPFDFDADNLLNDEDIQRKCLLDNLVETVKAE